MTPGKERFMKPIHFEFATATRILFGTGKVSEAGRIARTFGSRALLVTGSGLDRASAVMPSLREEGIETAILNVCGEPDTGMIERGVELARAHRSELVLGIGGGSVIDTGKAIAHARLSHPGTQRVRGATSRAGVAGSPRRGSAGRPRLRRTGSTPRPRTRSSSRCR